MHGQCEREKYVREAMIFYKDDMAFNYFDDERKSAIKEWIRKNNVSQELITKYAPYFPDKTMRNLIESGVIYYVA